MSKNNLIGTGFHIPYNPKLKERARDLRKNMTFAEKKLWYGYLKTLPQNILRQKPLNNYIVDFYCAQSKLVIEVDGESHFAEDAIEYDKERTETLSGYGLRVLRFTNSDIMYNFEEVCEKIGNSMK